MSVDFTKPLKTRGGRVVKILLTDGGGTYPVMGAWQNPEGAGWSTGSWTSTGNYYVDRSVSAYDLVNVTERRVIKRWHRLYTDGLGEWWDSRPEIGQAIAVVCLESTIEDGKVTVKQIDE